MRIVHLSDIHLDFGNIKEFQDKIRPLLIKDLININNGIFINLIIITGDLVDQGGLNLVRYSKPFLEYETEDPFEIFEKELIDPISKNLSLNKKYFLFIPGNHDIDSKKIDVSEEEEIRKNLNPAKSTGVNGAVDAYLANSRNEFNPTNSRLKNFKEFEKRYVDEYHNSDYIFSNNESLFIYECEKNTKIGFLLLNDSWRLSPGLKEIGEPNYHYVGLSQFQNAIDYFEKNHTAFNIILNHHHIRSYQDSDDILELLEYNNTFKYSFYGHTHKHKYGSRVFDKENNIQFSRCGASLNKIREVDIKYQPSYSIFDIDCLTGIESNYAKRRLEFRQELNQFFFISDPKSDAEHFPFDYSSIDGLEDIFIPLKQERI